MHYMPTGGYRFSTAKEWRQFFTTHILKGSSATVLWEIFQGDLAVDFASNLARSAALNLHSIHLMFH